MRGFQKQIVCNFSLFFGVVETRCSNHKIQRLFSLLAPADYRSRVYASKKPIYPSCMAVKFAMPNSIKVASSSTKSQEHFTNTSNERKQKHEENDQNQCDKDGLNYPKQLKLSPSLKHSHEVPLVKIRDEAAYDLDKDVDLSNFHSNFSRSKTSDGCDTLQVGQHHEKTLVVCVEGNIGCGKTTLLDYFHGVSGCEVIAEPVDKWRNIEGYNALELMYQNPSRWSMALQTYVQLTMLQNHKKPSTESVKLMERSIYSAKYCFTDNLFNSGKMTELEHIMLSQWFDWIIKTQNITVDLYVYLRTDPEILYSRILSRCRPEERAIPLDYLQTLHQLHEDWLINKKQPCGAEVLVIDANSSIQEMQTIYELHRSKILHLS